MKLDPAHAPPGYRAVLNSEEPGRHPCLDCDFKHVRLIDGGLGCKKPFELRHINCCAFARPDKKTVHFKREATMNTHVRRLYINQRTGEKMTRIERLGAGRGAPAGFTEAGELGRMDLTGTNGGLPLSDAVREASYRPDLQPFRRRWDRGGRMKSIKTKEAV